MDRLSAAAHAAARTGHDFNEVVEHFFLAYRFDQPAGVAKTADHGNLDGGAGDIDRGFSPAVHAADTVKSVRFRILSCSHVVAGAQRCFHDAAGGAEDHAGAGTFPARRIEFVFRQTVDINVQGTEIIDKFPGV